MTNQELLDYYTNLLIIQYHGLPKAVATVEMGVDQIIMNQLPKQIQDAFSLDAAVGDQLDVIGLYTGISRYGFDFSGPVTLGDDDYRKVIKMKITTNNSGSSLYDIQSILQTFFPNQILVFDFKNMQMGYYLDSSIGNLALAEFFVRQNMLPKPMAVALAVTIYGPDLDNLFGFRTYDAAGFDNHGFNTYSNYETDCPWLSYHMGVGV